VHWAPGIPHALCLLGAEHFGQTSGAPRRENAKVYLIVIASHRARVRATRWLAMTNLLFEIPIGRMQ
jgi:hypothetical protein